MRQLEKIASLKRQLAKLEHPACSRIGGKKKGARRGQVAKKDLGCYCCGRPGLFLKDYQGGQKQNNNPEADPESRRERQASSLGKAERS